MCIAFTCKYSCTLSAAKRRKKQSRTGWSLAASLLVGACLLLSAPFAAGAPRAGCPGADVRPSASNAAGVAAATLCLVDRIRFAYGLRPLRANGALGRVADSQVSSMVSYDYFADVRPTGQTPMSLVGGTHYRAHASNIAVGQNIAWGTGSDATPAHIVAEWMASPPHRAIILNSEYRDAGTAVTAVLPRVLRSGKPGAVYALELGVRR